MLVSDVLRGKGSAVLTIVPEATVADLVAMLAEHRIGAVVVSTDGTTVAGIASERDVVRVLASHGLEVLTQTVGQICTREVEVAGPEDRIEELMAVMTERRFRHIPVVVAGDLAGIVSIGDVVKARMSTLEEERRALSEYITGG